MEQKRIGVIGGSGLYEMADLKDVKSVKVKTPFGEPSDEYIIGTLLVPACNKQGNDREMVFLPRHGRGHRILPTELNFRANIYGMKKLGVEWILSVSAVGSMKEKIAPGHIVVPDQFFDMTRRRVSTFFGNGIVGHVPFADPICGDLYNIIYQAGIDAGATIHKGGTYLCIEGPQFSTRAESLIYRKWGVDVIGMTNVTEAKLSREAEICYATIALATDYDCWHESEEDVTVEAILEILHKNVTTAKKIIKNAAAKIGTERKCQCSNALKNAILTSKNKIPKKTKKDLDLIIGKYL
ncbi:MAG: S-methyl-5'-thioadenosine phosphorylase [Nitrospinae bacterium]|nr:S-methyl-5'-thioadenosine phosphorylase [Nitrospinota bacterium]